MADSQQGQPSTTQPANLDLIPPEMSQYAVMIADLTTLQQRILWALVDNLTAENNHTEEQIAAELGCDRRTIQRARKNTAFQGALAYIIRDNVRGIHDKIVSGIIKHGEKDWNAYKFLLQYDGSYVQKSQNMNINATIGAQGGANKPFSANVEDMLIRMGELGWTEDRVAELVPQFRKLKDEGAF